MQMPPRHQGLGTSASQLEPPLIGSPTVIAPKDLLQQLETVGGWEDKDDDDSKTRMKLTKKPSALMKKPMGKPAASDKRLQLGCTKCRGCKTGCGQCRKPSYSGKRGPGTKKSRY